ncbi:CsiV family protein [Paraglaciecola hydrolytica]|uniref:Uncharacterized protein n=1 Tax=Paraglaciecola hydrolytica TaxID=1799789 RepID=A0A136A6D5_9ALTE|nr:CsiV family protein [Paraglaciecola hydrolytica]KXI30774.1 hypothetical protein AX660_05010 [Paraglaciecola hydrolytica]
MSDVNLPMIKKKPRIKSCKLSQLAATAILLCSAMPTVLAAEQDWWFDVEVVIFKRDTSVTELSEKFVNNQIKAPSTQLIDLLTPYLQADLRYLHAGLPFCRVSERKKVQQQYEQDFAFPEAPVNPLNEPELTSVKPNNLLQDDFQYQVASDDIFAEKTLQLKQLDTEQTDIVTGNNAKFSTRKYVQDLSVNWIEWQIPQHYPCVYHEQLALLTNPFEPKESGSHPLARLDAVPIKINGMAWQHKTQAFLLPQSELSLTSLFKDINKQRDLQAILHMGWRQEVKFGQDKAQAIRVFAGKNYGLDFLANGHLRPKTALNIEAAPYIPYAEQQKLSLLDPAIQQDQLVYQQNAELFNTLHQVLNNEQDLELKPAVDYQNIKQQTNAAHSADSLTQLPIWQLDGKFKVYLQNVGRTPYLHIESDLDFRQPVFDPTLVVENDSLGNTFVMGSQSRQANQLQSVNFNQFKRVISKQLHYFDHPLFGMVVYITRYNWPEEPKSEQ